MPKDKLSKDVSKLSLRPPVAVQILAIICYTGFSIPVAIIALSEFGFMGFFLVLFIIWGWTEVLNLGTKPSMSDIVERMRPQAEDVPKETSGNASFDAYKAELLTRLEKEQTNFEGFLTRLRDAKDKSEFDTFMADRERAARDRADAPAV